MRCPVCNLENVDGAKFCSNCGNRMPERRTTGSSERRVVTVLFCDVQGSTTIAERLDPEEWTEVIDGAFRVLTPPVHRYGGTVARLLGDAVLAFFGAPVAHEDDPERALRAALDMLQAASTYRERLVRERGATFAGFDIRIGINTGLVVVGDVGTGAAVEYTGMGDAVNVAARLQSMAASGTMVVSEHTLRLVPPIFAREPLGDVAVRGRAGRVAAFVVRGLAAGAPARGRDAAPLVGRDRELDVLRAALQEVRKGSGRIVSLVGESGLGKTRLIEELRAEWQRAGGVWSESRGQSYEQTRPYGLIRQHLLSLAGVGEADTPETIRQRVAALLPQERRGDERSLRILEVFLAVEPAAPGPGTEGEQLRGEVHRLMREVALGLATMPSVFVFDDLHWSDAASAELLMGTFDVAEERPVLFICAFRPDRAAPSWRIKQHLETDFPHRYEEIALAPLSMSESAELLASRLPGDAIPATLRDRILEKAEGNPFFLEEIVRALVEDGTIEREDAGWRLAKPDAEIRIPDSLQALLAARIDRLEGESRETLQAAAVIGRTFLYRILAEIRAATDTLDSQLRALQRLELVQERAREPEREYSFRHALTQEAAYGSILQRRRRELHLHVGEALERLFPDRAEELAPIVGHHFAEAGDERAISYLKMAGDRALRLHALDDATAHYRRTLALLPRETADADVLRDVHLRYGRALELRGDYEAALGVYRELAALARGRSDAAMEAAALSAEVTVYANPTPFVDPAKAVELTKKAIELAREGGDKRLLARLLWNESQSSLWSGGPDAGIGAGTESAALAREIGDEAQLAFTLNALGQAYRETNRFDEAERVLTESVELFRRVGDRPLEADSLSTLAFIHLYRGEYDRVLERGSQAYRLGSAAGNEWAMAYALFNPGYVHFERGDWGLAIDTWEELVDHAKKGGFYAALAGPGGADLGVLRVMAGDERGGVAILENAVRLADEHFAPWRAWPLAQIARARIAAGDAAGARAALDDAPEKLRAQGTLYMLVSIALAKGELALAEGRLEDALRIARDDRRLATDRGLRPFEKDFDLLEGEALRALGDPGGARVALGRGVAASEAVGSRRLLWHLHGALAAIAEKAGDLDTARRERERVAEIVDHIARSLRARDLEDRFRARPQVRAALGRLVV